MLQESNMRLIIEWLDKDDNALFQKMREQK